MPDDILDRPPPPPPSAADVATPIGVPAGYVALPAAGSTMTPMTTASDPASRQTAYAVAPRYFDGDDLVPATLPSDQVAELQFALAEAGLLTTDFRVGVWDDASQAAYRQALGHANAWGLDDLAAIRRLQSAPVHDPAQQLEPPPADPDDLADQAETMFRAQLGRAPNADELAQVAMRWNRVRRRAFAAQQDPAAAPVDPESRMRRFFEDRYGGAIDRAERREQRAERQPALDASLSNIPVTGQF